MNVVERRDGAVDDSVHGLLDLGEGVEAYLLDLLKTRADPSPMKVEAIVNDQHGSGDGHDEDEPGEAVAGHVPHHEEEVVHLSEGGGMGEEPLVRVLLVVGEEVVQGDRQRGHHQRIQEPRGVRIGREEGDEEHRVEGDVDAVEVDLDEQLRESACVFGLAVFLDQMVQREDCDARKENKDEPGERSESEYPSQDERQVQIHRQKEVCGDQFTFGNIRGHIDDGCHSNGTTHRINKEGKTVIRD